MTATKASLLRLFNLNRTWCKITKQTRKTNQSFIYHPIKINDFNDFNFELKVFDWFLNNYLLTTTQTHLSVTDIVVYLSIHCSLFSFRFETPAQVFSCELCKIFKNTYFEEHVQTSSSTPVLVWFNSLPSNQPQSSEKCLEKTGHVLWPWINPRYCEILS